MGTVVNDGVKMCRACAHVASQPSRTETVRKTPRFRADLGYARNSYDEHEKVINRAMHGAKKRCENLNEASYVNYGARGIRFDFPSVAAAVLYVMQTLGPRPSPLHSIDRIDPYGNYAAGNLRWADRHTQRMNQREHERKSPEGIRISKLVDARPDYTYENIRQFVKAGLSDAEILSRVKGKHYGTFIGKNVRHN